jgi:hypothetical protein
MQKRVGGRLNDFWAGRDKMKDLSMWKHQMGQDSTSISDDYLKTLVESGKLTSGDVESVINNNALKGIPDGSKLTEESIADLRNRVLPALQAKEAAGNAIYNIAQLHVNNPVGDMQDLNKMVPGMAAKAVRTNQLKDFGRDRNSMHDMHTAP